MPNPEALKPLCRNCVFACSYKTQRLICINGYSPRHNNHLSENSRGCHMYVLKFFHAARERGQNAKL